MDSAKGAGGKGGRRRGRQAGRQAGVERWVVGAEKKVRNTWQYIIWATG